MINLTGQTRMGNLSNQKRNGIVIQVETIVIHGILSPQYVVQNQTQIKTLKHDQKEELSP